MAYTPPTRAQENQRYDSHQPGSRLSANVQDRMYGRCGCFDCRNYRKKYMGDLQAPINTGGGMGQSSINLCMRCGSMATGNAMGALQIRTSGDPDSTEVITKELCPGCIQEMVEVVEFEPEQKAQKAYREPYIRKPEADDVQAASAEQLAAALFEKLMEKQSNQKTLTQHGEFDD